MRTTFDSDSELTINIIDKYVRSCGISRSKVISNLLNSTSPALDHPVFQNSLKNEMETKLLNLFAYELREMEARSAKDEAFLRHFNRNIKKLSYVAVSKDIIQPLLPDRRHWPDLKRLFQGKINKMLDIYRPRDNGRYICVLYPDHLKVEAYTSVIINFRSLIADDYLSDINSLCFVREEDSFYCGINECMKKNLKNRNQLHLLWVPLKRIDGGYLFVAAMRKENLKYAVRREEDFIASSPYDV